MTTETNEQVGHAPTFRWMLTIAFCVEAVTARFSGWPVIAMHTHNDRINCVDTNCSDT